MNELRKELQDYIIILPYWDLLDVARRLRLLMEGNIGGQVYLKICVNYGGDGVIVGQVQRGKALAFQKMPAGKLMLNPILKCLGQIFTGLYYGITRSQELRAILVASVTDTKQVHIIPNTKETTLLGWTCLYRSHMELYRVNLIW